MAITNAQQFKQLVNPPMKGNKRPGYRGDAAARSTGAAQSGRADPGSRGDPGEGQASRGSGVSEATGGFAPTRGVSANVGPTGRDDLVRQSLLNQAKEFRKQQQEKRKGLNLFERFRVNRLKKLFEKKNLPQSKFAPIGIELLQSLTPTQLSVYESTSEDDLMDTGYGMTGEDLTDSDRLADAINKAESTGVISQSEFENAFFGPDGRPESPRDGGGDGQQFMFPQRLQASAPSITKKEEPFVSNFRLLAEGGRAGFQEGGIMPRLNQLGSGVSSAEQTLQDINQRLESAESSLGGGDSIGGLGTLAPGFGNRPLPEFMQSKPQNLEPLQQADPYKNTLLSGLSQDGQRFDSAQSAFDALAEQTRQYREASPFTRNVIGTERFQGTEGFKRFTNMFNKINDPSYVAPSPQLLSAQGSLGIPAAGYADGGNVVGGEFDFESARQMYGLGKLVKKVTRTVKKIAKSPLGKAAILGAGTYFGLGKLKAAENLTLLQRLGIAGAVAGLPFLSQQEEEEEPLYAGADIADPRFIMANPQRFQNIRTMAEGGSTEKEPVAKKTMPLLDMGGQEMDLRAEGGFVPIGRMEKADDVPARLSKNEFVFTADAVRNAGDGDVDKGAEVMYNMMKNLEAGGDVSEESQGLEGARKMFQTSQRLEEVL